MHNTAHITLTIEENVVEKLADLAGGESEITRYITRLILKLHAKKCGEGGMVDMEQLIWEVNDLLEKQILYEERIHRLQDHLDRITAKERVHIEMKPDLSHGDDRSTNSILLRRTNSPLH
jgi:hypothetical protein